ncbi:uncharacterized protein LOC141601773 [Silene latifolia]|uniref:uncharacterized protein LOC141601773 n=1 Tax=Silene latifolia TaxID=37657 RepID=UPI003D781FD0
MSLEESVKDLKNALSILTDRLSSIEDKTKDDGSSEDDITKKLKDKEKLIKRNTKYADLLDVECNMPNMRGKLPPKFTTTDLPKFKGTEHPTHHIRSFVQAMALKEVDASIFPAIFPSTLEDVARSWFFSLDPIRVSNWEDIKKEFLTQYSSNADLLITRRDLEVAKQTEKEGFTYFLARWRNKAAKMIERPPEAEQVDIFVKNLREPYKSHLRYAGIESFARLNKIGIQIEDDVVESTAKNQSKGCFNKDKKNFASTSKGRDSFIYDVMGLWVSDEEDEWEDDDTTHDIWGDEERVSNDIWADNEGKDDTDNELDQNNVQHLTRSGRHYKPTDASPSQVMQSKERENKSAQEDDALIKLFKKLKADITVWDLLCNSLEHRQAILNALTSMSVPSATTPAELASYLTTDREAPIITFSDKDLPPEGIKHNKALHLTTLCNKKYVPLSLVDNGSAVNLCPLRTAQVLGFEEKDFKKTNRIVRAYDNTRRDVLGLLTTNITTGPVEKKVTFLVIDIPASYNLLLGRPWLHELNAISSSLHQKVKMIIQGSVITLDASPTKVEVTPNPVLQVNHGEDDVDLWGFSEEVTFIEDESPPH